MQVRSEPDPSGSEAEVLGQYLDYQRETVLAKTEGLDREQMARPHPPSALTLGGLLYHLALVEEDWMEVRFLGLPDRQPWAGVDWEADPDWEFRTSAEMEPEQLRQRYRDSRRPEPPRGLPSLRPRPAVGEAASQRAALFAALDSAASHRGNGSPCGSRGLPARSHRRQRRRVARTRPVRLPLRTSPRRRRHRRSSGTGRAGGKTVGTLPKGVPGPRAINNAAEDSPMPPDEGMPPP